MDAKNDVRHSLATENQIPRFGGGVVSDVIENETTGHRTYKFKTTPL